MSSDENKYSKNEKEEKDENVPEDVETKDVKHNDASEGTDQRKSTPMQNKKENNFLMFKKQLEIVSKNFKHSDKIKENQEKNHTNNKKDILGKTDKMQKQKHIENTFYISESSSDHSKHDEDSHMMVNSTEENHQLSKENNRNVLTMHENSDSNSKRNSICSLHSNTDEGDPQDMESASDNCETSTNSMWNEKLKTNLINIGDNNVPVLKADVRHDKKRTSLQQLSSLKTLKNDVILNETTIDTIENENKLLRKVLNKHNNSTREQLTTDMQIPEINLGNNNNILDKEDIIEINDLENIIQQNKKIELNNALEMIKNNKNIIITTSNNSSTTKSEALATNSSNQKKRNLIITHYEENDFDRDKNVNNNLNRFKDTKNTLPIRTIVVHHEEITEILSSSEENDHDELSNKTSHYTNETELILPYSANNSSERNFSENSRENNLLINKPGLEIFPIISSVQSEMVLFNVNDNPIDNDQMETSDPLHCDDLSIYQKNYDNEVTIIKSISRSPICLDSEDDQPIEEQPPIVKKNNSPAITLTEVPSSNSSSKMSQALINKQRAKLLSLKKCSSSNKSFNQRIVATIDLLNSSEDEQQPQPVIQNVERRSLLTRKVKQNVLNKKVPLIYESKKSHSKDNTFSYSKSFHLEREKLTSPIYSKNYKETPQSEFLKVFQLNPSCANTNYQKPSLISLSKNIPEYNVSNSKTLKTIENNKINSADKKNIIFREWLENFLLNFKDPRQMITRHCYKLLKIIIPSDMIEQLKKSRQQIQAYVDKVKIQNPFEKLNNVLTKLLMTKEKQLTLLGRKFCEMVSKPIDRSSEPLIIDRKTHQVTSRTFILELNSEPNKDVPSTSLAANITSGNLVRKRRLDDIEYTPRRGIVAPAKLQNKTEVATERKKSLRIKRSRRYDNTFTYNEDEIFNEEEEEDDSYIAIQRRIEQKRLEAQRQSTLLAKSFESTFIKLLAKNNSIPSLQHSNQLTKNIATIKPADSMEHKLKDQLHHIYKMTPNEHNQNKMKKHSQTLLEKRRRIPPSTATSIDPNTILIDCDIVDNNINNVRLQSPIQKPVTTHKNTNRNMNIQNKNRHKCLICNQHINPIVDHYVNEHRDSEVFISRLSNMTIRKLKGEQENIPLVTSVKTGQLKYTANCIFCNRDSCLMLSYWYEHFTMHTGEYSYRCSGCGLRKPSRSLLMEHIHLSCKTKGKLCQEYKLDTNATEIVAYHCILCNYVQLNRKNIEKHLRTQHNLKNILTQFMEVIVLIKAPPVQTHQTNISKQIITDFPNISDDLSNNSGSTAVSWQNYDDNFMTLDEDSSDLSYKICEMLDVKINTKD